MTLTWHGTARAEEVVNLGPLALIQPLLDQLDIAGIIDRHLPPDPQLEFSHGQVLSLLLAARLCQPTALINLPAWADKTGADILWNLSADKLNDDRARLMALAIRFEHLVRTGRVASYAVLARLGQVTRARISQIANLLHLAPDIQEELLFWQKPPRGRDR